jgi:hypothetical protein
LAVIYNRSYIWRPPVQEAKQKAWHRVHKEREQGQRKWEVELDGLQICLQASEQAGGRFMLAADKASLGGLLQPEQLNAIHLDVDKVWARFSQLGLMVCLVRRGACDPVGRLLLGGGNNWGRGVQSMISGFFTYTLHHTLYDLSACGGLQVQALVSKTGVDPGASTSWLLYREGSSLSNEIRSPHGSSMQ